MSTLRPDQIASRFREALDATLGPVGWRRSSSSPDSFPGSDPRTATHHAYAVAVGDTTYLGDRQRTYVLATTAITIRFVCRLRSGSSPEDYDAALVDEAAVIAAAHAVGRDPLLSIRWDSAARSTVADGTVFLGELIASVTHHYPLS